HALSGLREVAERLARVAIADDGPDRHAKDQVIAACAVSIRPLTVLTALGRIVALVVKVEQCRERGVGFEPHATAGSAVAAIGATPGDELLAAKAHTARAPVSTLHEDVDLVDEHRRRGLSLTASPRHGLRRAGASLCRGRRRGEDAHVA